MYRFIYHISDIHIRLYHRQEEYQEVFDRLYVFLETEKEKGNTGLVVVTGDLLHHKNELSPECVVMTRSFLRRLGEIFTTVLIAGNHDALLNNQNRMDSLSAVLEVPCPNVLYYKNSGFYETGNVVFGVSSLLDKTLLRHKPFEGKTTIALFHGGVGRYSTNKGFWMEGVPLSTFEGYDLVLLGDIHLHQYLDQEKRVAYSGSLISQNFTETDPNHGVLVWDLHDFSSRLVRIPNPYAYREGLLEHPHLHLDGSRLTLGQLKDVLPPKGRLQITLSRRKKAEDLCWIEELQQMFPDLTIQEKPVLDQKPEQMASPQKETETPDLLHSYLRTLPEEWPDKERLLEALMKSLSWETRGRLGVRWDLIEMEFHDMFGYGKDNKICFSKLPLHETIGIFGENSAGKSTLIEILLFLLYGHITRYAHGASVPKEVIRFGKTKSWGKITFSVHGIRYIIEKKMTLQKSGKIRVDEKLWKIQDGSPVDLSEEHRKKTDKFVASQIGTWDQFLFTTVFLQQNERSFRAMSPKDRKEFLFEILDLKRLEDLEEETKEEWRQKKKQLELLEKEIRSSSLDRLQKEEDTLRQQILETRQKEIELDSGLKEIRQRLEEAYSERRPLSCADPASVLASVEKEIRDLEQNEQVETPEKDEKQCMEEVQRLYQKKVAIPERPSTRGFAFSFTDKQAFQQWQEENPLPDEEGFGNIHDLLREKEEWIQKLQPVPKNEWTEKGSKEWKSMLVQIRPNLSWEELCDREGHLSSRLESLMEEIKILERQKENVQNQMARIEARQAQTTKIIGGLEFSKRCSFCKKNQTTVSEICLESQIKQHSENLTSLLGRILPLQEERKEIETQMEKIKQQKKDWETVRTLQVLIHNRSVQKKLKLTDEAIEKVRREEKTEKIRSIWIQTLAWKEAVEINEKVDADINRIQTLLEKWRVLNRKKDAREILIGLQKQRDQLLSDLKNKESNLKIQQEIGGLMKKQESIQTETQSLLRDRIRLEEACKTTKEKIRKTMAQKEDYDRLLKEVMFLQHLMHVIGRDGFPMFLLETCLPLMEEQLNLLLAPFFPDKKVGLRLDRKKESTNVLLVVKKGDEDTIYLGGMEGFMVDAALKIVFSRMSRIPRSDIFIIDEGISALDKKNMENLDRLFQFLENYFSQVFIISHIKQAQDFVRHSLKVVKENGESRVIF